MKYTRHLKRDHNRTSGQAGFALLGGLLVWVALCGVALLALMAMTVGASKATTQQSQQARTQRAVDGALETAVNVIRTDPLGALGSEEAGACAPGFGAPTPNLGGASALEVETASTDVFVTIACDPADRLAPDPDTALGQQAASSVDLVGDGYQAGALAGSVPWTADCLSVPSGQRCFPWRLAIGGPNYNATNTAALAAAAPGLVHGSAANSSVSAEVRATQSRLQFASDVNVRRGTVALLNPATFGPAVSVAGAYRQGSAGIFSGVSGSGPCGLLGGASHPWSVAGAAVTDSDDAAGEPTCSDAGAGALSPTTAIAPPYNAASQTPTGAGYVERSVPACGAVGSVVTLDPGRYDKNDTATLNHYMTGGCSGRTIWFRPASSTAPGKYWFDVDDTSRSSAERNSLLISDPNVRVIFGYPSGGYTTAAAAAASFPRACDPTRPGVSVVLSPRTSLRHSAGRVALCDEGTGGAAAPALWQTPTGDGGWSAYADPSRSDIVPTRQNGWSTWGSTPTPQNPGSAWIIDDNNSTVSFRCNIILASSCAADVWTRGVGFGTRNPDGSAAAPPVEGPVRSLDLIVRAIARNNSVFSLSPVGGNEASTMIDVYKAGATAPTCRVGYPSIPDPRRDSPPNTISYDLFSATAEAVAPYPPCRDVAFSRQELVDSRVDVRYRVYTWVGFLGFFDSTFAIDGMELRTGWDVVPTAASTSSGWGSPANMLPTTGSAADVINLADGNFSGFGATCDWTQTDDNCPRPTRSVTLSGFDNTTTPFTPTGGSLLRAGVVVAGQTSENPWLANGNLYDLTGEPSVSNHSTITATLSNLRDTPSGSCTTSWGRVPFWGQGLYLDLLASPGNCASLLTNAEQLIGATLDVSVYMRHNNCPWAFTCSYSVRLDGAKISTVSSGSYTRPKARNSVTLDGSAASFNVYGTSSLSRNDLNISWNGQPPVDPTDPQRSEPIFGGRMVLAGMGSYVGPDGSTGVLCCGSVRPAERRVTLTAHVRDPETNAYTVRGVARVVVDDASELGVGVAVHRWDVE